MKTILKQSAWALVAANLILCSPMTTGAGDKDKQQENNKGQDKGKDKEDRKDRDKDERDRERKDRDRDNKDHKAKDRDHDDDRHKITICHRGHTISVSKSALQAHLNHGDTVGPCDITPHRNK